MINTINMVFNDIDNGAGMNTEERQFPIHPGDRKSYPDLPVSVPWSFVAPHEAQAQANHSQTLERLAERAGLAWSELRAVIEGKPWDFYRDTRADAEAVLIALKAIK